MTISPPERGSTAKSQVEKVDNPATFELFGKPGHFDRALAKGPKTTTWVWNLHANAHDFPGFVLSAFSTTTASMTKLAN